MGSDQTSGRRLLWRAWVPGLAVLALACGDSGVGSGAADGNGGDGGDGTTTMGAMDTTGAMDTNGAMVTGDGQTGDGDQTDGSMDPNAGSAGDGGNAGGEGPLTAPTHDYAYSACTVADRVGSFSVKMVQPPNQPAYTSIEGLVRDGLIPTNIPEDVMTAGECKLVRGRNLFCEVMCEFDETCGETGECQALPVGQDMGIAEIAGLLDGPISMEARASKLNYAATGSLSYPAMEEGARVTLATAGATGPALGLVAEGVAPLAINESEVPLRDGSPATVTWNPPATAGRSRVLATVNISLHGGDPVRIECDAEDDGTLEIAAELVSELLTFDYSGFPAISLVRQSAEATEGPHGCIDFRVMSSVERHPVQIEGLTSCNETQDTCAAGQTCDVKLMRCQ